MALNGELAASTDGETSRGQPEIPEEFSTSGSEGLASLNVILPHDPAKINIVVSVNEQIHEIRQSVIDHPAAFQHTCFHLEYHGARINDFAPLSEVPDLDQSDAEIRLVEDPYTEREARIHVVRIRELVGASSDRTDPVQGISAGLSLLDDTSEAATESGGADQMGNMPPIIAAPSPSSLLARSQDLPPKTVKSISLSSWNPPPCHWRQRGHLLYLCVTTIEGEQHQITSHVGGFYLNKSSNSKFDPSPRPAPKGQAAHSLLTLIGLVSPSFVTSFGALQDFNGRRDVLSTFQVTNSRPSAPWAVPAPAAALSSHSPDPTRFQETYLLTGVDNTDSLRDWNEEIQSAKELPRESIQDRLFRERLLSKLFADYVDAATHGAVLVARGEVAPLNPTECNDAQIFIYNNVFFSFGADGVGTFTSEGGDAAARIATGKDVHGARLVNNLDIEGLYSPATVVVDYHGKRIVAQSIVPGIFRQREPGENQIDYGAVDGKDVIASDERFAGTFAKMSRAMRIKRHPVWDKSGEKIELEASVETKGLLGTDGRKYVLDLYRTTPLDIMWIEDCTQKEPDSQFPEYPHRMSVLRYELIDAFALKKTRQASRPNGREPDRQAEEGHATGEPRDSKPDGSNDVPQVQLNPDVFSGQIPQTDEDKSQHQRDEEDVRMVCEFLRETVIPGLLRELSATETSFPIDAVSLTQLLHKRGINVRYLGRVATLSRQSKLPCMEYLCLQDMIARAFKHIASSYLRLLPSPLASSCVAHLLNCLLGYRLNGSPVADTDPDLKKLYRDVDSSWESVSVESLRSMIQDQVSMRFRYRLSEDWHSEMHPLQLLRLVSIRLGLQLQARDYVFEPGSLDRQSAKVVGNESRKKKKKGCDDSPEATSSIAAAHTFCGDDIMNIVPIVKDSTPKSALALEALHAGQISLAQDQKKVGQELLLESLSLHEQIYGILHPEVAGAYSTLSMLYFQLGEKDAAIELARKAAIVAERTLGVDHPDTVLNYLNLGLFLHQSGDSRGALVYTRHALNLWKLMYAPEHPDSITTLNNAAVMLQNIKAYHESRLWFEESLRICEVVYGRQTPHAATLLFQLAQALALDQDSKGAVRCMRESYTTFLAELGPKDKNTREAESWLEQLTQNAVSIARHAKDSQEKRLRHPLRFASLNGTYRSPGTVGSEIATEKSAPQIDSRSIDELMKFIEGTEKQNKPPKGRQGRGNLKRRGKVTSAA